MNYIKGRFEERINKGHQDVFSDLFSSYKEQKPLYTEEREWLWGQFTGNKNIDCMTKAGTRQEIS